MPEKFELHINPQITVSPKITVSFPIRVTVIVKLFERLLNVVKKEAKPMSGDRSQL